jgi:hypothetical protein
MNRIYRLVWCRSRKVLVVASELASAHHGGESGGRGKVDRRSHGATQKLLLAALIFAGGVLFASAASAQSTGDAKLDDLQSLVAKYDTSHAVAASAQAIAGTSAAGAAAASPSASAAASPSTAPAITSHFSPSQVVPIAKSSRVTASAAAPQAASASMAPITYGPATDASSNMRRSDAAITSGHSEQASRAPTASADVADRNRQQATGSDVQLAQQSSLAKTDVSSPTTSSVQPAARFGFPVSVGAGTMNKAALATPAAPLPAVGPSSAPVAMLSPSLPTRTPDSLPDIGAVDRVVSIERAPVTSAAVSGASTTTRSFATASIAPADATDKPVTVAAISPAPSTASKARPHRLLKEARWRRPPSMPPTRRLERRPLLARGIPYPSRSWLRPPRTPPFPWQQQTALRQMVSQAPWR